MTPRVRNQSLPRRSDPFTKVMERFEDMDDDDFQITVIHTNSTDNYPTEDSINGS